MSAKKSFFTFATMLIALFSLGYADLEIQEHSLLNHTRRLYSQNGEEGIIDEILSRLKIEEGFFVEFGACDGIVFSNTKFLADRGWKGAFIECDPYFTRTLVNNYRGNSKIICIDQFVTTSASDTRGATLDTIADNYFPKEEIDVLSIDIDGSDYLIFEQLNRNPKIVCIESSGYWHPSVKERIPDEVASKNLGQPLSVMIEIAKNKGYEPVCFLSVNLFLVRRDFYHLFSNIKNDPVTLWMESWCYLGKNQPGDQNHIRNERKTDPIIHAYDHFPTP